MQTKGFTLVEVLIGLFIAIVAATYSAKTITSTNKIVASGRDTFIATNLAHEGLDLTRALRDTTWFADATPTDRSEWLSRSGICESDTKNTFAIDPDVVQGFIAGRDAKVKSKNESQLYIQENSKQWTHEAAATAIKTAYKREVEADCAEAGADKDPAYATITSTVTWEGQGGVEKKVQIKELLYNWWPEEIL